MHEKEEIFPLSFDLLDFILSAIPNFFLWSNLLVTRVLCRLKIREKNISHKYTVFYDDYFFSYFTDTDFSRVEKQIHDKISDTFFFFFCSKLRKIPSRTATRERFVIVSFLSPLGQIFFD